MIFRNLVKKVSSNYSNISIQKTVFYETRSKKECWRREGDICNALFKNREDIRVNVKWIFTVLTM